jgi:RNA polymerase sigma factor (sigma-70 family)
MISEKPRVLTRMTWTDEQLVKACLEGRQDAWSDLIDKYKNLIYSIPIKYGISRDDAGEIFQKVCLRLLSELPNVRDPKSLGGWLIKVTSHICFEWTRRERLQEKREVEIEDTKPAPSANPDEVFFQVEREQILREALLQVTPRCRKLIHMLFYETPAVAYEEVARNLRLATGSIGFIRMRCLKQLQHRLKEKGFL